MKTYFLIRNKTTGKFIKRNTWSYYKNEYVSGADDATLIRSKSAASMIINSLDKLTGADRYLDRRKHRYSGEHEVICVNVLIYPVGIQPFIDGVLNGKP